MVLQHSEVELPLGEDDGPLLSRGPFFQEHVVRLARFVERVFNDSLLESLPGGLTIDRIVAGSYGVVPGLAPEVHYEIVKTFLLERLEGLYQESCAFIDRNGNLVLDPQRLKHELLDLSVDAQKYVMAHFKALASGQQLSGPVHPLARMLFAQPEETVKEIIVAMLAQVQPPVTKSVAA